MATTRAKADNFIREMGKAELQLRIEFGIAADDITVSIRIKVEEYATYNSHEDED
jgi:hypothetical protein